jgi:hypothetical protein
MINEFVYLTRLLSHCNELEKNKNTVSNLEFEKKKLFTINHINSIDLVCLFLLSNKHWIYPIKDEKTILIIYYNLLRLELNIVYNEFLKSDKELEKLSISTLKNNRRIINWMKYMFVKLLLNETHKHETILKNETNNAYLDYISDKNYHEKIFKKPKIFPNISIYDDAMSEDDDAMSEDDDAISEDDDAISELTSNSYDVDSSSDFELEPNVKDDYIDDEDYSKIVDDSDDETTDKKDIYKRTFSRSSNKLNKEIMNAYKNKNKKRRKTNKNKKDNTNTNKKTDMPYWTKEFIRNYKCFDTPSKKINGSSAFYNYINDTNMTELFDARKTIKNHSIDNKIYLGVENFKRDYENEECKLWEFIDKDGSQAYIFFDKTWKDWYALKTANYDRSTNLGKFNKLITDPFKRFNVWKSSNVGNIIDIIMPSNL